jgi:DNA excision repair protein ERCC-4
MTTKPLSIVVDTREQKPYLWEGDPSVAAIRAKLPAGDYSLCGYEDRVAVERKSLDDLVDTIIKERDRFFNELRALDNYQDAAMVVEASISDITHKRYKSQGIDWKAVLGSVFNIQSQFRMPIVWAGDRAHGALATKAMLWAFMCKVRR